MSSPSSNDGVLQSVGVKAAIFGFGVVMGTGVTVLALKWRMDELRGGFEFLGQEIQKLRDQFQGHLDDHSAAAAAEAAPGELYDCRSMHSSDDEELFGEEGGRGDGGFHPFGLEDPEEMADTTATPRRLFAAREQELSHLLLNLDRLMEGSDSDRYDAYTILNAKSRDHQAMTNANFLWRYAKATFLLSQLEDNENAKKNLVHRAKELAARSIQLDTHNSEAHKWWAITLGAIGGFEGISAKIQNGYKFKKHIEISIGLNPTDAEARHLMGRWCYEVATLPWTQRRVASMLLATPPTATIDEALGHFLDVERLSPSRWKENLLYIAKCYIEKNEYGNAFVWLKRAHRMPVKNSTDAASQRETEELLTRYRGHFM